MREDLKQLSTEASNYYREGKHVDYIRENLNVTGNSNVTLAHSRMYKPGEIVRTRRDGKAGYAAFITSIRWCRRVFPWGTHSGYGGYLVAWPNGCISTCTNISKFKKVNLTITEIARMAGCLPEEVEIIKEL